MLSRIWRVRIFISFSPDSASALSPPRTADVTLDPDAAHPKLILSVDLKSVNCLESQERLGPGKSWFSSPLGYKAFQVILTVSVCLVFCFFRIFCIKKKGQKSKGRPGPNVYLCVHFRDWKAIQNYFSNTL